MRTGRRKVKALPAPLLVAPLLNSTMLTAELGYTHRAALLILEQLADSGLLRRSRHRVYNHLYVRRDVLPLLTELHLPSCPAQSGNSAPIPARP